ncbi:MAG: flagellar biosynthesis protein [Clostridia bacterium]|nr:flagellar biosynthesis protein [Clostridia bacterium]
MSVNNMEDKFIRPVITGIPTYNNSISAPEKKNEGQFGDIFQEALKELKFSKHAEMRIMERSMTISDSTKEKVNEAIDIASKKGIKDSLILFNDMAFVVNIDSRTIITAIDKNNLENRVFTNIDGAVYI